MAGKKLSSIKSGVLSRGLALAKLGVSAGAKAAGHALGAVLSGEEEREQRFRGLLMAQAGILAKELGNLKGSLMKAGQMLTVMGEHVLPPEVNSVLKSLQSQSPPLEWKAVEKSLRQRLGARYEELEVEHEPMASASLGQVHRARVRASGEVIVLKIQYPGVDRAIDSDIQALRRILSMSRLVPGGPHLDAIFNEVRAMLRREVDYGLELEETRRWMDRLAGDSRYIVPRVHPQFSTRKVLALSLEEGLAVDSPEVAALSAERRNAIGLSILDLYLRELFEFQAVQTDPHLGNYRVRLGKDGQPDQVVLFDFGAVREVPPAFLTGYRKMVRGAFHRDPGGVVQGAREMGYLREDDGPELEKVFVELCELVTEPFLEDAVYDFGSSDLPLRSLRKGSELAMRFKLRPPPQELVFLDRKMGGVYTFLKVLRVQASGRSLIARYL